jgi:pyrroloquinoline quinone biosynthesis protein B
MRTLQRFPGQVTHRRLALDKPVRVPELADVTITAFVSPGTLPVHLVGNIDPSPEDNVGVRIEHARKSIVCATSVRDADAVASKLASDVLFFDGTFWSSDELGAQKLGTARAEDMAHHPLGGSDGSLERLATVPKLGRKILTHINNSNPILRDDSHEHARAISMGWELAYDGMEVAP